MRRLFSTKIGAVTTSAALLLAAGAADAFADTYTGTDGDNFIAGSIVAGTPTSLTVHKFLTEKGNSGTTPTGSEQDMSKVTGSPAPNVVFSLCPVTPENGVNSDMALSGDNNNEGVNFTVVESECYYGKTGGTGLIEQWYKGTSAPTAPSWTLPTGQPATLPNAVANGPQYYVLHELNAPANVTQSQDTLFSIPLRVTNTITTPPSTQQGYIYNVSVFPKNGSKSTLTKNVTNANGNALAQIGDTLNYTISQEITNTGTVTQGDANLDTAEIGNQLAYGPIADGSTPGGTVNDSAAQLRIVDQVSTALALSGVPNVTYTCGPTSGTVAAADYVTNYPTGSDTMPNRVGQGPAPQNTPSGPIFPTPAPGQGTKYVTFDFFTQAGEIDFSQTIKNNCGSNTPINISITFTATVTGAGDSTGGTAGQIQNTVASDVYDGKGTTDPPSTGTSDIPTAGFQFLKTAKDGLTVLPGATFALVNPTDQGQYLSCNGTTCQFAADPAPAGFTRVTATSNAQGLVTFVGLPILTSGNVGVLSGQADWDMVELSAPSGYSTPSVVFGGDTAATAAIMFDSIAGQSAADIAAEFPNGVVPDTTNTLPSDNNTAPSSLYTALGTDYQLNSTVTNNYGQSVNVGMKNFTPAEAPIGLPLTGGKGIIIFLAAGVLIMTSVLVIRGRRQRKAQRA